MYVYAIDEEMCTYMYMYIYSVVTPPQAMAVLNHVGIFLSYNATWVYLRKLTEEADYMGQVKQGRWL